MSKLDRLYRFHRHDTDGDVTGCSWNLAAGSLEKRQRLYRVHYTCQKGGLEIKDELTIDVKKPEPLRAFFDLLHGVLGRTDLHPRFQEACVDLLVEDPWLSAWTFTNSRPVSGVNAYADV